VLPLQQPFGQELALQTQWPVVVLHCCPGLHETHAAPPAPHAVLVSLVSGSQLVPLQQPVHPVEPPHEQTPFEHDWPWPQGPHAAPAVPHCEVDWEV
jgi:hypothetical protein